jgi:hypothetical protein
MMLATILYKQASRIVEKELVVTCFADHKIRLWLQSVCIEGKIWKLIFKAESLYTSLFGSHMPLGRLEWAQERDLRKQIVKRLQSYFGKRTFVIAIDYTKTMVDEKAWVDHTSGLLVTNKINYRLLVHFPPDFGFRGVADIYEYGEEVVRSEEVPQHPEEEREDH